MGGRIRWRPSSWGLVKASAAEVRVSAVADTEVKASAVEVNAFLGEVKVTAWE